MRIAITAENKPLLDAFVWELENQKEDENQFHFEDTLNPSHALEVCIEERYCQYRPFSEVYNIENKFHLPEDWYEALDLITESLESEETITIRKYDWELLKEKIQTIETLKIPIPEEFDKVYHAKEIIESISMQLNYKKTNK